MGLSAVCPLCMAIILALPMLIVSASRPLDMITTPNTTKPGCPRECGNMTVPYPFGIGAGSGCSLNSWYNILCATSFDPPKAFLSWAQHNSSDMVEVLDISDTEIRVRNDFIAYKCYNSTGHETSSVFSILATISYALPGAPYRLSAVANRLTAVGCNDGARLSVAGKKFFDKGRATSSCRSNCIRPEDVVSGGCNGRGCCEASIQSGSRQFTITVDTDSDNHTSIASWNPCGYAFVGEHGSFDFRGLTDLNDSMLVDRIRDEVPVVLDWLIGDQKCSQASQNLTTFLCKQPNTICIDVDPVLGGHRCSCKEGYQGNPYLPPGCTDTDECAGENNCSMRCFNTRGSYYCACPPGYDGDGRKDGTKCKRVFPKIPVAIGTTFGFIFLVSGLGWSLLAMRKKRITERRNEFFQQNGGFLLKQMVPSNSTKIFTIKELKIATNNFSEDSILGKGGYGTVFKGILPENQVVAVKKSKIVDESQIEQFINELVILTRVEHPNVVKILGCCLEAEVPLLVYEFIPNGTLYDQIHAKGGAPWLSWSECLRIAAEAAEALAYLHSIPIIHRDIKCTNILLDDNHVAKISDFGISRLIPMDKIRLDTLVQGTMGYLDPEYFFSSQLTNKSDVYSFGVVLAELLTREAPILDAKCTESMNLSMYFVKSMEEGRLTEVVHPRCVEEASQSQLQVLGWLIQSCLSIRGQDRPTMEKLATILGELRKL